MIDRSALALSDGVAVKHRPQLTLTDRGGPGSGSDGSQDHNAGGWHNDTDGAAVAGLDADRCPNRRLIRAVPVSVHVVDGMKARVDGDPRRSISGRVRVDGAYDLAVGEYPAPGHDRGDAA